MNEYYEQPPIPVRKVNRFGIASIVMAILAFMNCYIFYLCFLFAGPAVIFAILAKGDELKMNFMSKVSVVVASVSLVITVVFTSVIGYSVMKHPEEYKQQLDAMTQSVYGVDFDQYMNELMGGGNTQ